MKFVMDYRRPLRRKKPGRRDTWRLHEGRRLPKSEKRYLWRASIRTAEPLGFRNAKAAQRVLKSRLHMQRCWPRRMGADERRFYAAARRKIMRRVEHDNRA